jgi:hypothetical protein
MSAINFPISTLRREGTNLKPLDNKLFCDVINILEETVVDGNFSWIRHSIKPNCDHDIPYISILHEHQHFPLIINNVRPYHGHSLVL